MSDFILNNINLKGHDWALTFLIITMFFEFSSGILKSLKNHSFKSAIGKIGFTEHILIFTGFFCFFYIFIALPTPSIDISVLNADIGDCIAYVFYGFYIVVLWGSIAENLNAAGIPLPKFITQYLFEANETIKNGSITDITNLGSKLFKTAKNPTKTLQVLIDEESNFKNGTQSRKKETTSKTEKLNRLN